MGREIEITDPVNGGVGYVYLCHGQAGADPSAGVDHVDYTFALDSGPYLTTYERADGPNPESSTVTTDVSTLGGHGHHGRGRGRRSLARGNRSRTWDASARRARVPPSSPRANR